MAFNHKRFEVGAGIVEGSGVTGTSGAHDHEVASVHSGDYLDSEQQISLQACRWSAGRTRPATQCRRARRPSLHRNYGDFFVLAACLIEVPTPRRASSWGIILRAPRASR